MILQHSTLNEGNLLLFAEVFFRRKRYFKCIPLLIIKVFNCERNLPVQFLASKIKMTFEMEWLAHFHKSGSFQLQHLQTDARYQHKTFHIREVCSSQFINCQCIGIVRNTLSSTQEIFSWCELFRCNGISRIQVAPHMSRFSLAVQIVFRNLLHLGSTLFCQSVVSYGLLVLFFEHSIHVLKFISLF